MKQGRLPYPTPLASLSVFFSLALVGSPCSPNLFFHPCREPVQWLGIIPCTMIVLDGTADQVSYKIWPSFFDAIGIPKIFRRPVIKGGNW